MVSERTIDHDSIHDSLVTQRATNPKLAGNDPTTVTTAATSPFPIVQDKFAHNNDACSDQASLVAADTVEEDTIGTDEDNIVDAATVSCSLQLTTSSEERTTSTQQRPRPSVAHSS